MNSIDLKKRLAAQRQVSRIFGSLIFRFFWSAALTLILVQAAASATVATSVAVPPPTLTMTSAAATCSYYATDTYLGAEGTNTSPVTTILSNFERISVMDPVQTPPILTDSSNNATLSWTGGTGSPLNTAITCAGTYKVFFTIQLQAAATNSPVQVSVCDQTTDAATLIYGSCPASGGTTFTFNPQCNGGNYCTVMTFPFAAQVHLNVGQTVGPPALHASGQVAITGGQFFVYYVGP
jgi:hypothetical protein